MKLLLLACDLVIVTVYGLLCAALFPLHVGHVVVILLFFLAQGQAGQREGRKGTKGRQK